jgi:hypothetical protein
MTEPYGVPDKTMNPTEFSTVSGALQTEKAEKMEFEKVENDRYLIEYGEKDGRAIFHIFAKSREIPWGHSASPTIKVVLEGIFTDGEMEWIPEALSWFFRPTRTPLDYKVAAEMVLTKITG